MKKPKVDSVYSRAGRKATAYRTVISRLLKFADNEVLKILPNATKEERIIRAQYEPFWSAAKELRDLTDEEKRSIGL